MAPTKARLKLVIDKNGKRVLFAEGGEDFVNFLIKTISLPIANAVNFLNEAADMAIGSLHNLYHSVKYLNLLKLPPPMVPAAFYKCRNCLVYSNVHYSSCPNKCGKVLTEHVTFYGPEEAPSVNGNVRGSGMTYMVTDGLTVTPMSTISAIKLLNKFNVTDADFLEEMVVDIDIDQGYELLKNILTSKTVLTNIFRGEIDKTENK